MNLISTTDLYCRENSGTCQPRDILDRHQSQRLRSHLPNAKKSEWDRGRNCPQILWNMLHYVSVIPISTKLHTLKLTVVGCTCRCELKFLNCKKSIESNCIVDMLAGCSVGFNCISIYFESYGIVCH